MQRELGRHGAEDLSLTDGDVTLNLGEIICAGRALVVGIARVWRVIVFVPAAVGLIVILSIPSVKLACPRTVAPKNCSVVRWRFSGSFVG